jgi:hypothetical protein
MACDMKITMTHNEESKDYKITGYYCIYNSNKQPRIKNTRTNVFYKNNNTQQYKTSRLIQGQKSNLFRNGSFYNSIKRSQTNLQNFKTELKDFLTPYINRNYQLILLDYNINLLEIKQFQLL